MHQPKLRPRFSFDASDKLLLQLKSPPPLTQYDPKKVGELIRHMRDTAGLSQGGLGDRVHKTRGVISRMELGTHRVSLEFLMSIAKECGFQLCVSIERRVK